MGAQTQARQARPMPERLLKTHEVLALLNISRTTLYRWVQQDRFPRPLKPTPGQTGATLWKQSEVLKWLKTRQRVS